MNQAQRRGLARLMLRWPKRRTELSDRCGQDPHFPELSEAYEAACGATDYWATSSSPEGQARAEEYRALAFEIERAPEFVAVHMIGLVAGPSLLK
ncbi:hypothetical protein QO058_14560 [Bosea vestrisii]|uniref:hypothetical protein n=1 Tax=Bosea vestrisii TaxID=151416 RepID=UPI0024DF981D|nr:hypothetical protein [Bosea vestrisii]WID99344.1 hypothetical protein QO058_14560 [Bosea vestrisii]